MDYSDYIMTVAVVVGPIAAILIQIWSEKRRSKINRKHSVFKTLISSRKLKDDVEIAKALNMVEVEFYQNHNVISAWRIYLDYLEKESHSLDNSEIKYNMFVEMLYEMAKTLNYNFDQNITKKDSISARFT